MLNTTGMPPLKECKESGTACLAVFGVRYLVSPQGDAGPEDPLFKTIIANLPKEEGAEVRTGDSGGGSGLGVWGGGRGAETRAPLSLTSPGGWAPAAGRAHQAPTALALTPRSPRPRAPPARACAARQAPAGQRQAQPGCAAAQGRGRGQGQVHWLLRVPHHPALQRGGLLARLHRGKGGGLGLGGPACNLQYGWAS